MVWNGVNMTLFVFKSRLVCRKLLTAIRQESPHSLHEWAYLKLFGIVWHFGHESLIYIYIYNRYIHIKLCFLLKISISERLKRYVFLKYCFRTCKFGKSDPQLESEFCWLRLLICWKNPQVERKEERNKLPKVSCHILRVKVQNKKWNFILPTEESFLRAELWDVSAMDVWMFEIFLANVTSMTLQRDANEIPTYEYTHTCIDGL